MGDDDLKGVLNEWLQDMEQRSLEHAHIPGSPSERIVHLIKALRLARAEGNIDGAVQAALCLGLYLMRKLAALARSGIASLEGGKRGGRKPGSTADRDMAMAREFLKRKLAANCSDTALKRRIGRDFKLGRSQAIKAIDRALKQNVRLTGEIGRATGYLALVFACL